MVERKQRPNRQSSQDLEGLIMRHSDLIQESVFGSNDGAKAMIQQTIMALAAQGVGEISTSMIAQELQNKMRLDIPYAELVELIADLPIVDSADSDTVTFRDDEQVDPEGAQAEVADMAGMGNVQSEPEQPAPEGGDDETF